METICITVTDEEIDLAQQIGAKAIRKGQKYETMVSNTEEGTRLTQMLGDRIASRIIRALHKRTDRYYDSGID